MAWVLVLLALCLVNLWTFTAFAFDKARSRQGGWRVSEAHLLTCALIGGSPAALIARRLLRHKTRKQPFGGRLMTIVSAQGLALAFWAGWIVAG